MSSSELVEFVDLSLEVCGVEEDEVLDWGCLKDAVEASADCTEELLQ